MSDTTGSGENFCEYWDPDTRQVSNTGLPQNCKRAGSGSLACDPRVGKYVNDNKDEYKRETGKDLTIEQIVEWLDTQKPDENANAVKKAIPGELKIDDEDDAVCSTLAEKCPVPAPWTSWNCHCPQGSSFQAAEPFGKNENPDNLPLCECGKEKVTRRRYQLCKDSTPDDKVTCKSMDDAFSEAKFKGKSCPYLTIVKACT